MLDKNSLFALVIISFIILSGFIFIGSQFAPKFTFYLIVISTLVIAYASTEKLMFHDAAEFENRFWTTLSFFFAYVIILVEDSPFRLPNVMAWCIIIGFSYLAHNYNRSLHRMSLKKPMIIPSNKNKNQSSDERKLPKIFQPLADCMSIIDHPWISSNIFLPGVLYAEKKIISIFDECSADDLNTALPLLELSLILYKIKDHRFARLDNRSKLLKLLCVTRVRELKIQSKAMLLDAMMRLKLSANKHSEAYARNIICGTYRNDLTELKCIMDSKLDINSMHKLVFEDIRDHNIRQQIISHIKKQANEQIAHSQIGSKEGKESRQLAWRKILSDVDDTLLCSGGNYPTGVDKSYPYKAIYPGVLGFYRELDLGTQGDDIWDVERLGNLVFLSARPHVYKDLSESRTFLKFQQIEGLRTRPALLAGSLGAGTKYMLNDDTKALATTKYQSYKEYISLYPEYRSVFIGDNGQGDVLAAELMFTDQNVIGMSSSSSSSSSQPLTRAYMHIVKPIHETSVRDPNYKKPHVVYNKICYFYTYIDAAIDAYHYGLIRLTGLRRIMVDSITDFNKITKESWDKISSSKEIGEIEREKQIRLLNRSIEKGNKILIQQGLEPITQLRFRQTYAIGQLVKTRFGYGVIEKFRTIDGIYTIALPWDKTGQRKPSRGYFSLYYITKPSEKAINPMISSAVPIITDTASTTSSSSSSSSSLPTGILSSFTRYKSLPHKKSENSKETSLLSLTTPMSSSFSMMKTSNKSTSIELQRQLSLDKILLPSTTTSSINISSSATSGSSSSNSNSGSNSSSNNTNNTINVMRSTSSTPMRGSPLEFSKMISTSVSLSSTKSSPASSDNNLLNISSDSKSTSGIVDLDEYEFIDSLNISGVSDLSKQGIASNISSLGNYSNNSTSNNNSNNSNNSNNNQFTQLRTILPYSVELERITGKKFTPIASTPPRPETKSIVAPSPPPTGLRRLDSLKPLLSSTPSSLLSTVTTGSTPTEIPKLSLIIGSIAWTPYGRGYVLDFRQKENILVVRFMDWKGFSFLRKDSVVLLTDPDITLQRKTQLRLEEEYNLRNSRKRLSQSSSQQQQQQQQPQSQLQPRKQQSLTLGNDMSDSQSQMAHKNDKKEVEYINNNNNNSGSSSLSNNTSSNSNSNNNSDGIAINRSDNLKKT